MRKTIFSNVLKVIGVPVFLVKWILKIIWFLTYGLVGFLYKITFINGKKSGKIAYTIISVLLLICVVTIFK